MTNKYIKLTLKQNGRSGKIKTSVQNLRTKEFIFPDEYIEKDLYFDYDKIYKDSWIDNPEHLKLHLNNDESLSLIEDVNVEILNLPTRVQDQNKKLKAFRFNKADQAINTDLNIPNSKTMSFWIRSNRPFATGSYDMNIGFLGAGSAGQNWGFLFWASGDLGFWTYGPDYFLENPTNKWATKDIWIHVVAVNTNNKTQIYINGKKVSAYYSQFSDTNVNEITTVNSIFNFAISNMITSPVAYSIPHYTDLSDIRVYDEAVSEEQVVQLYNYENNKYIGDNNYNLYIPFKDSEYRDGDEYEVKIWNDFDKNVNSEREDIFIIDMELYQEIDPEFENILYLKNKNGIEESFNINESKSFIKTTEINQEIPGINLYSVVLPDVNRILKFTLNDVEIDNYKFQWGSNDPFYNNNAINENDQIFIRFSTAPKLNDSIKIDWVVEYVSGSVESTNVHKFKKLDYGLEMINDSK